MTTKEYNIKVPGNSGCGVEIVSCSRKPAVRKWTVSKDYSERLEKQREKQKAFKSTIKAIHIPKIIDYDDMSFTMEYLHMLDSIEFFEIACPQDIKYRLNILLEFVAEELATAESSIVNTNLFQEKLSNIEGAVPPEIWRKYYRHQVRIIRKELPENLIIPLGQCHGDLTFSNIMFSLEDVEIGLIDFLDSFLESPIIDIVKIRQDTKFNWTNQRYKLPHDTVKISIVMFWLDGLVESAFSDIIDGLCFRIIEKINYLRIAPYVNSTAEHEYLSNTIAKLEREKEVF